MGPYVLLCLMKKNIKNLQENSFFSGSDWDTQISYLATSMKYTFLISILSRSIFFNIKIGSKIYWSGPGRDWKMCPVDDRPATYQIVVYYLRLQHRLYVHLPRYSGIWA